MQDDIDYFISRCDLLENKIKFQKKIFLDLKKEYNDDLMIVSPNSFEESNYDLFEGLGVSGFINRNYCISVDYKKYKGQFNKFIFSFGDFGMKHRDSNFYVIPYFDKIYEPNDPLMIFEKKIRIFANLNKNKHDVFKFGVGFCEYKDANCKIIFNKIKKRPISDFILSNKDSFYKELVDFIKSNTNIYYSFSDDFNLPELKELISFI